MSRSSRRNHESQIDPFNAGEPIMPWDDPSAMHDEECVFSDDALSATGGYQAPAKRSSNYDAPSIDENPARSSSAAKPTAASGHAATDGPVVEAEPTPATGRASSGSSSGKRHPKPPVSQRKSAARSRGAAAPAPARKRKGRIGCIVAAFLVVCFLLPIVMGIGSCVSDVMEDIFDDSSSYDYEYSYSSDFDYVAAENACQALLEDRVAAVDENDTALVTLLSTDFSTRLKTYLGYTAEELGLDADAYARWLISGFSSDEISAYCYSDGTGTGYITGTAYEEYSLVSDFYDVLYDYLDEEDLNGNYEDNGQGDPLTDEQKAHVAELLAQVQAGAETTTVYSGSIDLSSSGNVWSVDEDSFVQELAYALGASY